MFKKVFSGAIGAGLPFEDNFSSEGIKPSAVRANLEHLRPMLMAVREMTKAKGWTEYIKPFLEKQGDARQLIEMVMGKQDATAKAAEIKAYSGLLNYVNSLARSADSLERLEIEDAEGEKI